MLDSPVRRDSSISVDLHFSTMPSTRACSPARMTIRSSTTISDWSISTSFPSRTTETLGLTSREILSSLRLARISWMVEIRMLAMMIPVADTALTTSSQMTRRIPMMKRTTLKGVKVFFTKMSVYVLLVRTSASLASPLALRSATSWLVSPSMATPLASTYNNLAHSASEFPIFSLSLSR